VLKYGTDAEATLYYNDGFATAERLIDELVKNNKLFNTLNKEEHISENLSGTPINENSYTYHDEL
jgi:hypothetical protein